MPICSNSHHQNGAALMVMMVILVLGTAAFLVSSLSRINHTIQRTQLSSEAMNQAKEALISYAITYADNNPGSVHGYLPCPDEGQNATLDGEANGSCGATNVSRIGKLPWRKLGLPPLKDSNGECLWYAVSGSHKNNPQTLMMNEDTEGLFEVMTNNGVNYLAGSASSHPIVAVIFSPGPVIGSQNRSAVTGTPSCGGNYTASNYLDNDTVHGINNAFVSSTANAITRFISGSILDNTGTEIANDRMVVITKEDIFNAMMRRKDFTNSSTNPLLLMTKKAAECIADYGRRSNNGSSDKRLPWAGRAPTSPASSTDIDCNLNGAYKDGTSTSQIMFGRLPNRVSGSRSTTNNQIASQTYGSCTASYYQLKSYPGISPSNLNCPNVPDWSTYYPWWSNWKDHVFYSVSASYRPAASYPSSCGTCLKVNNSGAYAAVVLFAGSKLSNQSRTSDSERLNFTNYLEGNNLTSTGPASTSGNGNYQSGATSSSFNDTLFCINPTNLTVSPC